MQGYYDVRINVPIQLVLKQLEKDRVCHKAIPNKTRCFCHSYDWTH